jgi:hypothetical protein
MTDVTNDAPQAEVQEKMLKIYKSRLPRITYVLEDGQLAVFAPRTNHSQGHYLTDDPKHISELDRVCKKHPHLYIDPEESEIAARLADPAVAMREQIREEERAKLIAELGDPNQPRGLSKVVLPEALAKRVMGDTPAKAPLGGIGNSESLVGQAESNGGGASGTK